MKYDFEAMHFCSHGVAGLRAILSGAARSQYLAAVFGGEPTPEGKDFWLAQSEGLTPEGRAAIEAILAQADNHGGLYVCPAERMADEAEIGQEFLDLFGMLFGGQRYDAVIGEPLTPEELAEIADECEARGQNYTLGEAELTLHALSRNDVEGFTQWVAERFPHVQPEASL